MRTLRRRLLGLLLVAVLAGGVTLSIAMYNRAFSDFVEVKLDAGDIGNAPLEVCWSDGSPAEAGQG